MIPDNIKIILKYVCCGLLALAVLIAGTVFIADPYCHYRPRSAGKVNDAFRCNVGIARNAVYDTVFIGNAGFDGFKKEWISSITGSSCVCLPFENADIDDYDVLLSAVLKDETVKRVFIMLDNSVVTYRPDGCDIPRYLSKPNIFTEPLYLLNIRPIVSYIKGSRAKNDEKPYSAEDVLKSYKRPEKNEIMLDEDSCKEITDSAVETLYSHIVNNPDTEFIFFIPPYSILYWDKQVMDGTANAILTSTENACLSLLLCDNVKVYYFQNVESIIKNLNNYKGIARYSEDVCRYMLESYAQQKREMSGVNADENFASMWEIVYTFDYDSFLAEILK